jgi:integrase
MPLRPGVEPWLSKKQLAGHLGYEVPQAPAIELVREPLQRVAVTALDAINDGLHPGRNPFANLRLEQSRGRKDLVALRVDELHELADTSLRVLAEYGPTFRAMILFAGYAGLRPGELFALERGDLTDDEVHIRRNLDGTGQLKLPKNGKQRTVILPPPARDALLDVPPRVDTNWLFVTSRSRQLRKSSRLYYWNPVRAAFGRPGMNFYDADDLRRQKFMLHVCDDQSLDGSIESSDGTSEEVRYYLPNAKAISWRHLHSFVEEHSASE